MPADNERDELALVLRGILNEGVAADAILSSSWLAGKLKQARADAWEEARSYYDGAVSAPPAL